MAGILTLKTTESTRRASTSDVDTKRQNDDADDDDDVDEGLNDFKHSGQRSFSLSEAPSRSRTGDFFLVKPLFSTVE
jgi:hypothetical protein